MKRPYFSLGMVLIAAVVIVALMSIPAVIPIYVDIDNNYQLLSDSAGNNTIRQLDVHNVPGCSVEQVSASTIHVYLDYDESADPDRSNVVYVFAISDIEPELFNVYTRCQAYNIVDSDEMEILFETYYGGSKTYYFHMTSMSIDVGDDISGKP